MAREGVYLVLAGMSLALFLFFLAGYWSSWWLLAISVVVLVLAMFTSFFFRDPHRQCDEQGPGLLVSPADGTVIGLEHVPDHAFVGPAVKISIFLSILDVHINRVPVTGVVEYVRYRRGGFAPAFKDKASEHNEHTEIGISTGGGSRVTLKQIAGAIARRVVCRLVEGETCRAGSRFGMIRFGSRVELFVPENTSLHVRLGDHVLGGRTVIGYLPEVTEDGLARKAAECKDVEL